MDVVVCPSCAAKNRVPKVHAGVPQCGRCKAPLPWVADAGDADFDEVTGTASLPVLVDVWATWCAPCRIQAPHVERLSVDLAGRIKVVKVDSDQAPAVAQRFGIRGVPTLLLLDKGRLLDRRTGALLGPQLRRWVEDTIAHAPAA